MSQAPPKTDRLAFAPLTEADAPDLAEILSDPEVARGIMAKATTPAQCLACARSRIDWHNAAWETSGIGVWGLTLHGSEPSGRWC
jgi:RimJ/RimL family protein N-acetyltransferase